ncbi:MAG: ATP-binding protein [Saprospiraceae bacterium]|nr:ATP-binding protein [Saprospiraceae bacterium]
MILEFKIENFRSFKTQQNFSFVAEATKSRPNNVFDCPLPKGTSVRLLKTAVMYGANASGKSNFLKAFHALRHLVVKSNAFRIDKEIDCYEPFLLDRNSRTKPTKFEITFILSGEENVKYRYSLEYNATEITAECLDYFPNGQTANLFKRVDEGGEFHEIELGKALKRTGVPRRFLKNQLILSKFGSEPHEQLNDVFRFFQI